MHKLSEYIGIAYQNALSKGWYENPKTDLEFIMLMISEVSEATEEVRKFKPDYYEEGKPEGQSVELSDLCIRIFDYSGYKNINLSEYLEQQFFVHFNNIEYLKDIKEELKQINNFRGYEELENIETDIEFHATITISLANAASSIILKNKKEPYFIAEALAKVIYYSVKKGWNIEDIIYKKQVYNLTRAYKHGGKKC